MFHVKHFDELTAEEIFEILYLRVKIFVVEQQCIAQEVDRWDKESVHVFALDDEGRCSSCLRVFHRDEERSIYPLPTPAEGERIQIGRVVTLHHGHGEGGKLLRKGVEVAFRDPAVSEIVLESQVYAIGYYETVGFKQCSEEFMEDGIPHVMMRLTRKDHEASEKR